VFGISTGRACSPQSKRGLLQVLSHQLDDLTGLEPKLFANRFERRTIFPGHLNDAVRLCVGEFCHFSRFLLKNAWLDSGFQFRPAATTTFAAIFDVLPCIGPFLSPGHCLAAGRARLSGQILFVHFFNNKVGKTL
jgi:hypothetical protein